MSLCCVEFILFCFGDVIYVDKPVPPELLRLPWLNRSTVSDIVPARIVHAQRLTAVGAKKKSLLLRLQPEVWIYIYMSIVIGLWLVVWLMSI